MFSDYEAVYVIRDITIADGTTTIIATLTPHTSNRVAVLASEKTVYGWEPVAAATLTLTVARELPHLEVGQVIKPQSCGKVQAYAVS